MNMLKKAVKIKGKFFLLPAAQSARSSAEFLADGVSPIQCVLTHDAILNKKCPLAVQAVGV